MDTIADNPPLSDEVLMAYQQAGHAWVAADSAGVPGGFVVIDLVDGCAHIEQISVHPRHARQGWGRKLIGHVAAWSTDRGIPALTLTTFRDVPFNAPYYRRLGFTELEPAQFTPGLVKILDAEAAFGLDLATRVCMHRPTPAR